MIIVREYEPLWADREDELKQIRFEIIAFAEQERVSFERALNYLMNDYDELQGGLTTKEIGVLFGINSVASTKLVKASVKKMRFPSTLINKAFKEYTEINLIEDTNLSNESNVYDYENRTEYNPREVMKTAYNH